MVITGTTALWARKDTRATRSAATPRSSHWRVSTPGRRCRRPLSTCLCCGDIAPSGRAVFRLEAVEGIAADQVSAVGVERKDGSLVTVAVADNSYRFARDAIPSDPVAIVALDESGAVVQRKTVG